MVEVLELCSSVEDDRPAIDFTLTSNRRNDWRAAGRFLRGEPDAPEEFPLLEITVRSQDATDWDCYNSMGMGEMFSERFLQAVGDEALRYFERWPVLLNDCPYYLLRCKLRIDCLDREHSEYRTFNHRPSKIKDVQHYVFHGDQIPQYCLFCVPDILAVLFCTQDVARVVQESPLKGVDLIRLP